MTDLSIILFHQPSYIFHFPFSLFQPPSFPRPPERSPACRQAGCCSLFTLTFSKTFSEIIFEQRVAYYEHKKKTKLKPLFEPAEAKKLLKEYMEEKKQEKKLEAAKEKLLTDLMKKRTKSK